MLSFRNFTLDFSQKIFSLQKHLTSPSFPWRQVPSESDREIHINTSERLSCSEKKKVFCVKNNLQCSRHSSIFVTSSVALCWPGKRNTGLFFSHWLFKACPCYFDPVIKIQCYLFNAAIAM